MFVFMTLMLVLFVALVFYLAKLVVLQFEQRADEDMLNAKDVYQQYIEQKEKILVEKQRLEKEMLQIFTLYDMTKEITRHFSEIDAFNIFRRKLNENMVIEDCQFFEDISGQFKEDSVPAGYAVFTLNSKQVKLGVLVYKGVGAQDQEKFDILAHQFALALRRIRLYRDIERLAITDSLTGVYTRRYFLQRLDEEVKRSALRKTPLAFLMIDVDHFKMINDQYGHLTGDEVLKEIGGVIRDSIRAIDIAGRYGGEEFCVVLPDSDLTGSKAVAERIRVAAEQKMIQAYDNTVHVTLSIGVAVFPQDGGMVEELMDKADWALYRAKSQGRNCVVAFGSYQGKDGQHL